MNEFLGVTVAGALLYPSFMAAIGGSTTLTFLGMTLPVYNYSDSVFPVILGVGLLSIVYHVIDKFVPAVLKMVVVPALSLTITIPYNNTNIKHNSSIELDATVSDNSDIPERLFPGQFTRWTLVLHVDNAYLFSAPYKNNVHIGSINVETK